jgi:hypothetical protein
MPLTPSLGAQRHSAYVYCGLGTYFLAYQMLPLLSSIKVFHIETKNQRTVTP